MSHQGPVQYFLSYPTLSEIERKSRLLHLRVSLLCTGLPVASCPVPADWTALIVLQHHAAEVSLDYFMNLISEPHLLMLLLTCQLCCRLTDRCVT